MNILMAFLILVFQTFPTLSVTTEGENSSGDKWAVIAADTKEVTVIDGHNGTKFIMIADKDNG